MVLLINSMRRFMKKVLKKIKLIKYSDNCANKGSLNLMQKMARMKVRTRKLYLNGNSKI